jgi:hypothetical protein
LRGPNWNIVLLSDAGNLKAGGKSFDEKTKILEQGDLRVSGETCCSDVGVPLIEVDVNQLKSAVEAQHGCTATFLQSVPVKETFEAKTVWAGVVQVFRIDGHPRAKKAYAWSSPIEGGDKRRYFAVLHLPPVTSPVDAVRAAIVAEHRQG